MDLRQARRDEVTSLQQDIGQEFAQSLVGKEVRLDSFAHETICLPAFPICTSIFCGKDI